MEFIVASILGGLWTFVVYLIGRKNGYATRSRELPKPPKPVPEPPINYGKCVCGHAMSAHAINNTGLPYGKCKVEVEHYKDLYGERVSLICACHAYVPEKRPAKQPTPIELAMKELEGM